MSKDIFKLGLHLNDAGMPSQGLFIPQYAISLLESKNGVKTTTLNDIRYDSNIASTSSFRYDTYAAGVKNTQQFRIDFSRFENHTFFNSAEVNVNVAFQKIINQYPFDGSRQKTEAFFDGLTGFENHVFQVFPKNIGYLILSGSATDEADHAGTYISVSDSEGSAHESISTNTSGRSTLSPNKKPFTIEMQLFVPDKANDNQVIVQSLSGASDGNVGMTLALTHSVSTTKGEVFFGITSGSTFASASAVVTKGQFNHLVALYDQKSTNLLKLYVDGQLASKSNNKLNALYGLNFFPSNVVIGSGSVHGFPTQKDSQKFSFTPKQTLSGAIDEFRFFHESRSLEQQTQFQKKSIFSEDNLKLYFKFNEPKGVYNLNSVALDSSGNALHTTISNYSTNLRLTGSSTSFGNVPITFEDENTNPVLFPDFFDLVNLNSTLLTSASRYDDQNPNLITRLVPQHYLNEGYLFESLAAPEGSIGDSIDGQTPGALKIGSQQMIASLLFVWAKFFDELKISIDQFSNVSHTNYTDLETTPDQLLAKTLQSHGFEMSNAFQPSSVKQWVDGDNLDNFISKGVSPLSFVQNEIWRRILTNIPNIIQSKGTLHCVKAMFRCIGINPDTTVRIREYGGPSHGVLGTLREGSTEISSMLDFSLTGSSGSPLLRTPYLSSSRVEAGYPWPLNASDSTTPPRPSSWMSNDGHNSYGGVSPNSWDGNQTSGSFTYEGIYKFATTATGSQSLVRMFCTGGSATGFGTYSATGINYSDGKYLLCNLVANPDHGVKLFVQANAAQTTSTWPALELHMTGVNIFDGNKWNVSFGRFRDDDPAINSPGAGSSSFFLRVATQNHGTITRQFATSTFYSVTNARAISGFPVGLAGGSKSMFESDNTQLATTIPYGRNWYNYSGSFLSIGAETILTGVSASPGMDYFLNGATNAETRATSFDGKVSQMRFWSRGLLEKEWLEHVRNFKSVGVQNPNINYNFVTSPQKRWNFLKTSGSFERIRLDYSMDQLTTSSNYLGEITVFDYSQQTASGVLAPWRGVVTVGQQKDKMKLHASGTGFAANTTIFLPERFDYSMLSPRFDEAATDQKVRVRSYLDPVRAIQENAQIAPFNDMDLLEQTTDDSRFSIDFSIASAMDEDIILIFSTFDELESAIGDPANRYAPDYIGLANLRKIYFDRLTSRMNFKNFFDFFQWFDTNYETFIHQLIPDTTHYLGTNFVIESHMLERHKIQMLNGDLYLSGEPSIIKGTFDDDFFDGKVNS